MEWIPSLTARELWQDGVNIPEALNVPCDIDHEDLDNIPQRITKTCLDEMSTMFVDVADMIGTPVPNHGVLYK